VKTGQGTVRLRGGDCLSLNCRGRGVCGLCVVCVCVFDSDACSRLCGCVDAERRCDARYTKVQ
jgi:hypothetical protein